MGQEFIIVAKSNKAADLLTQRLPDRSKIRQDELLYLYGISRENMDLFYQEDSIFIERVTSVELRNAPNDLFYPEQWSLRQIEMEPLWDITTGGKTYDGKEIVVAVVDRGFDTEHQDIQENIYYNQHEIPNDLIDNDGNGYIDDYSGYNVYTNNDNHIAHFHGTGVCGIIGGQGNNQAGIAGINWKIAMMPISTSNPQGILTTDLYEMYQYILDSRKLFNETNGERGAYIVAVNASLGVTGANPADFPIWCEYIEEFGRLGILYVGSTANENWDVDRNFDMPISCTSPFILSVTNSDMSDQKPEDAGYGHISIDIAAPGEQIYTTRVLNQYGTFSGTSSSSPHVTGLIGLLYSYSCSEFGEYAQAFPRETALVIKNSILQGADQNDQLQQFTVSGGRLNAINSFNLLDQAFCNQPAITRELNLKIFPTITQRQITVDYISPLNENLNMTISNRAGQLIYRESLLSGKRITILLMEELRLAPGMYFLTLNSGSSRITKKFFYTE